MSVQYDLYLQQHRSNVHEGFNWIRENLPELLTDGVAWQTEFSHDISKNETDEYEAYDRYFYGNNKSYQVVQDYRRAWLLHLHRNPHHWQHWILINDDPKEGEIALDMPYNYILEMICDWWAFSWQKGNLHEIFNWYDEHKDYMKMSRKTRKTVDDILGKMKQKLSESDSELAHHGVKGQKWGVRNGPPYPIKKTIEKPGKGDKLKTNLQMFAKIAEEKFTKYALDPEKCPDKAAAFKKALGYTKENYKDLIDNIEQNIDEEKFVERGDRGFGMRYEQIMKLKGPNGREANVITAWIQEENDVRLTSAYITEKELENENRTI